MSKTLKKIIISIFFIFFFTTIGYAQNEGIETNNQKTHTQNHFSVCLSSGKYFDNNSFELTWIDDNRLLFREERQLKLIINISDEQPEVITITDFLMKETNGNVAPYYYIPELDYIIFAEEKPNPRVKMYSGKGQFIDYLVLKMEKLRFKLDYNSLLDAFLILVDDKLLLVRSYEDFDVIKINVVNYIYKKDAKEVLIFTPTNAKNKYNLEIMSINHHHNSFKVSDNIICADYYPESKLLYYASSVNEKNCNITVIEYKSNLNMNKSIIEVENVSCNGFEYISTLQAFIYTQIGANTDKKTLYIVNRDGELLLGPIENICDYEYNEKTGDIILFYQNSKSNLSKIKHLNVNHLKSFSTVSNNILDYQNFFYWNKELDIITYIEQNNNENEIIVYSLINKKELIRENNLKVNEYININVTSNQVIALSYMTNDEKNITYLYNNTNVKQTFDNSYYCNPYSENIFALIECEDNKSQLIIYRKTKEESDLGKTTSGNSLENMNLNGFELGIKASGLLTLISSDTQTMNAGYEIALFTNYRMFNFLRLELSFIYARRQFTFDPAFVSGENPLMVNSIFVFSDMFSVQFLASSLFTINRFIDIYIPVGGRLNISIKDTLHKDLSTGGSSSDDFGNEMKDVHFDITGGCGFLYRMDNINIFAELLLYLTVGSSFEESYLTDNFKIYKYPIYPFGLQLNIGISFLRFPV